jgi:hypothetical protein
VDAKGDHAVFVLEYLSSSVALVHVEVDDEDGRRGAGERAGEVLQRVHRRHRDVVEDAKAFAPTRDVALHVCSLQFERQILKPVFSLDRL